MSQSFKPYVPGHPVHKQEITPAPVKPESNDDSNPQRGPFEGPQGSLPGACVYISSDAPEPKHTQAYIELWANMMVLEAVGLGGVVVDE